MNIANFLLNVNVTSNCNLKFGTKYLTHTVLYMYDDDVHVDDYPLYYDGRKIIWYVKDDIKSNTYFNYKMYIIQVSNCANFLFAIRRLIVNSYWHEELSRYAIFLVYIHDGDVRDAIEYMWDLNVYKVIFVDRGSNCNFFTYDPLSLNYSLIHRFDGDDDENATYEDIFPFLYNFKNVTVNVEILPSFYETPYIDLTTIKVSGLLINSLHVWCGKYNCKINFDTYADSIYSQDKFALGYDYLVNSIYNGSMDMTILPMLINFSIKQSLTHTMFNEYHICIVPKPNRLTNSEIILLAFEPNVWYLLLSTLVIGTIITYLLNNYILRLRHKSYVNVILDFLRVFLSNGVPGPPKHFTLRLWLVSILFLAFNVGYMFQAKYNSLLTVPKYRERIDSDEKLARSNLTPSISVLYTSYVTNWNNPYAHLLIRKMKYRKVPVNKMEYITKHPGYALYAMLQEGPTTSKELAYYEYFKTNILYDFTPRYMLRYGSIYMESLNNVTRTVYEGAFVRKWYTDLRKIEFHADKPKFMKLKFEHAQFAFIVDIGGHLISVCIFVAEILIYKCFYVRRQGYLG